MIDTEDLRRVILRKDVPSKDQIVEMVRDKLDDMSEEINHWKNKCKELESNHWKDDKLSQMKEERDRAIEEKRLGFYMTEEEWNKIQAWKDKHLQEKHNGKYHGGAIGGTYSYIFTPTSIGTPADIQCSCGERYCFRGIE